MQKGRKSFLVFCQRIDFMTERADLASQSDFLIAGSIIGCFSRQGYFFIENRNALIYSLVIFCDFVLTSEEARCLFSFFRLAID